MRVLITNDDGVRAPGLAALVRALRGRCLITIVAPERELSGIGHAISLAEPISIRARPDDEGLPGWAVRGTPADCVKLAWWELMAEARPDVVVSGINRGANVGLNVLYSGTVAAAREAAILGAVGLAFSLDNHDPGADFGPAAELAAELVITWGRAGLEPGTCINVNIPDKKGLSPADCRPARQSLIAPDERFINRKDPRGNTYYWQDVEVYTSPPVEDTDRAVLERGLVSVTALRLDQTADDNGIPPLTPQR